MRVKTKNMLELLILIIVMTFALVLMVQPVYASEVDNDVSAEEDAETKKEDDEKSKREEEIKKDKTKPELVYAYMLEGKLYLKVDDEVGLDNVEAYIDGDEVDDFKEDGYKIDIPTKLVLEVEDLAGNVLEVTLNVSMEDEILSGDVPEKIKDKIKKNQTSRLDFLSGFEHIVEGEYGKVVNVYEAFEDLILLEFGKHNEGDIIISSSEISIDNDYSVLLNKEGFFKFKISHTFYNNDYISVYIFVDEEEIKYTNIDEIHVVNPGLVNKNSVTLRDFLNFELIKDGYQPVITYIVAKDLETNKDVPIGESISIEEDKIYRYVIHDMLTDSRFEIEFKKRDSIENEVAAYKDVSASHWAFYHIKNLTLDNFITGYPDQTFKPGANITVREFSTILSRYLSTLETKDLKPVVENYYINPNMNWGYIETKAVLAPIPRYKTSMFDFVNVDRPITREEVAFLIASNIDLEIEAVSTAPIDSMSSKYALEILQLVASEVMQGYPDNTFKPTFNITRAEIAAIFDRLINQKTE